MAKDALPPAPPAASFRFQQYPSTPPSYAYSYSPYPYPTPPPPTPPYAHHDLCYTNPYLHHKYPPPPAAAYRRYLPSTSYYTANPPDVYPPPPTGSSAQTTQQVSVLFYCWLFRGNVQVIVHIRKSSINIFNLLFLGKSSCSYSFINRNELYD